MKNSFGRVLILFSLVCIISPVGAWHADATLAGPAEEQCPTCDFYRYSISANSLIWCEHILRVNDTLPVGLEYVSGSSATEPVVGVDPIWDASTRTLTWDFKDVPQNAFRNITFNIRPTGLALVKNTVETRVMPYNNNVWEDDDWRGGHFQSNTVTTFFSDSVCPHPKRDPVPAPEFPTIALPAGLIAGLLGFILVIKRTKEN